MKFLRSTLFAIFALAAAPAAAQMKATPPFAMNDASGQFWGLGVAADGLGDGGYAVLMLPATGASVAGAWAGFNGYAQGSTTSGQYGPLVQCQERTSLGSTNTTTNTLICDNGSGGLLVTPRPTSSAGLGFTPVISSSAAATCQVLKASAGNLYYGSVLNAAAGATAGFLEFFNSTTAPSNGTVTMGTASGNLEWGPIPVASGALGAFGANGSPPTYFTVGITECLSSTAGTTFTGLAQGTFNGEVQ